MLINSPNISGSLKVTGNAVITGSLTTSIAALNSAASIFLTSDGGTIKSRTAAQTLSDLGAQATGSYVPYTGATTNVNLGDFVLSAGGLNIDNLGNNGGALNLRQADGHSLWIGDPYTSIYAQPGNRLIFRFSNDNRSVTLDGSQVSAATPRTFTFPDATGTFALTSQIPTVAGEYLPLTGGTITGSLIVTEGITGDLTGSATTASYVEYTDVVNKPTLVSSSVQVKGYNVFATTGSNQFNGSQSVTGSLTVTGQVIAQTLNVQEVTSSIVFSSGSNRFGNNSGNTHQFTGSVSVTGSLAVAGAGTFSSNVGINGSPGTSFPLEAYINSSTAYSSTSRGNVFRVYNSNTSANIFAGIELGGAGSANDGLAGLNAIVTGNGSAALTFYTRDSNTFAEKMRITSAGNVGIGTDSPSSRLSIAGAKTNSADLTNAANQLTITDTTATAAGVGGRISFLGSYTATPDYITFGAIEVLKDNANNYGSASWNNAAMRFIVGNNDNDANAGRMLERMRITSGGNVGIGDTSPQSGLYIAKYGSNWDGDVQYNKPTGNIFLSMGYSVSNQDNWFGIRGNYGSSSGTANILLQANYRDVGSQAGHYIASKATALGIADFEIGRLTTSTSTSTPPTKVPQLTITSSGAATFSSSLTANSGLTVNGGLTSNGNVRSIVSSPVGVGDDYLNVFKFVAFAQGGINQANSAVNLRVAFALTGGYGNEHCTYDLVASCSNGTWTIHVDSQTGRVANNGGNFQVSAHAVGTTLFIRSRKEFGGGAGYAQMNGMINFAGCNFSTA
jgi:hypothetical protein